MRRPSTTPGRARLRLTKRLRTVLATFAIALFCGALVTAASRLHERDETPLEATGREGLLARDALPLCVDLHVGILGALDARAMLGGAACTAGPAPPDGPLPEDPPDTPPGTPPGNETPPTLPPPFATQPPAHGPPGEAPRPTPTTPTPGAQPEPPSTTTPAPTPRAPSIPTSPATTPRPAAPRAPSIPSSAPAPSAPGAGPAAPEDDARPEAGWRTHTATALVDLTRRGWDEFAERVTNDEPPWAPREPRSSLPCAAVCHGDEARLAQPRTGAPDGVEDAAPAGLLERLFDTLRNYLRAG